MSEYKEAVTTLESEAAVKAALTEMGFKHECHAEPQTLYGYHGEPRPEKAHIIIRRLDTGIGASNDIGFLKQANGTYKAIISEYDESSGFNAEWLGKLGQLHTIHRHSAILQKQGFKLSREETVVNGKQHLKLYAVRA